MVRHSPYRPRAASLSGRKACRGFTLIELMVTVVILAVLAAVSFPMYRSVQAAGYRAHCTANLQQLGSATLLYMQESNNTFPTTNYWAKEIAPYLNTEWVTQGVWTLPLPDGSNPYLCPASLANRSALSPNYNYQLSYGINSQGAAGKSPDRIRDYNSRARMTNMILYADGAGVNLWRDNPERVGVGWHPAGVNVLFCDFHVETVDVSDGSSKAWHNMLFGIPVE